MPDKLNAPTSADVHCGRPGFVYGVAISSSRQEVGLPPCACPCHLADRPRSAQGWYCDECYAFLMTFSYPAVEQVPYSHEQAIVDGKANPQPYMVMVPDYYFITKGNTLSDELEEHFASSKEAEARAKELNEADAIASLRVPRTHRERFDRFRDLHGDYFGWWYYGDERHPLTRLPRKPGRYAVAIYWDDGSDWKTVETLDEARELIAGGDVDRIVDLDTGDEVPFKVAVSVEFGL